ncbi:MAG: hypothetical protein KGN77_00570 [Xanthomonadaceae bacterium]|nr:hypothetical protein [Xanthomonadaceae bacterium]MDE1964492.1 hypothetical protein [Xanthomonadaceae bacterium]
MRSLPLAWITALATVVPAAAGRAADLPPVRLVAIAAAGQPPKLAADRDQLRNVFLKKIFIDDRGLRLIPVNLPPGTPLRERFATRLLGMGEAQLADYWNRQYFQGVSPPYVLASQQAVVRFVAATPGAIGYVASCHLDAQVRVLLVIDPAIDAAAAGCTPTPAR